MVKYFLRSLNEEGGRSQKLINLDIQFDFLGLHCHAIKKIIRKLFSELTQEIMKLQEIDNWETSPSFGSVRFPDLQIFLKILCTNLQSPVWTRHVGVPPTDTNMAAGKQCKHLELTLANQVTDYLNGSSKHFNKHFNFPNTLTSKKAKNPEISIYFSRNTFIA